MADIYADLRILVDADFFVGESVRPIPASDLKSPRGNSSKKSLFNSRNLSIFVGIASSSVSRLVYYLRVLEDPVMGPHSSASVDIDYFIRLEQNTFPCNADT